MPLCAVALQQSEVLWYVGEQYYAKRHTLRIHVGHNWISKQSHNNLESYYVLLTLG